MLESSELICIYFPPPPQLAELFAIHSTDWSADHFLCVLDWMQIFAEQVETQINFFVFAVLIVIGVAK